jgi:hypothetical protein
MAMPWDMVLCIAGNVWLLLGAWISTCFLAADEVASLLRSATGR